MTTIRRRQLGYLGHAIRADGLEKSVLLGFIEGRRARGRQRLKYVDGIMEVIGCSTAAEVERLTEDRGRWHTIVANVNIDMELRQGKVRYPSKMVKFCHFWFYSAIWSLGRGAPLRKNLGLGRIKYMHKYAYIMNRFSFWKTELYNKQGLKAFTKKN